MVPALAHKGVYRWRCCVKGQAAHSSLTPQSVNAIEVGARVVGKLADMAERWRDGPRYEGFDVPYTTGSVGVIEGGIADNVVPEDCRFHYEFRNLPGSRRRRDAGAKCSAFAAALEPAMRAVAPEAGIRFETICEMPAFLARADDPAVRLARPPGRGRARRRWSPSAPRPACSSSAGIPTVVCGPGHIAQAHQADEYVSLAQLAAGERFLLGLTTIGIEALAAR